MARVPAQIINPMRRDEALASLAPKRQSMLIMSTVFIVTPIIVGIVLIFVMPEWWIGVFVGLAVLAGDLYVLYTLRRTAFGNPPGEPGNELWLPGSLLKGMEVGPMVSEASMYEAAQIVRSGGDRALAQSRLR